MNTMKERPEIMDDDSSTNNGEFQLSNCFQSKKSKDLSCEFCSCERNQDLFNDAVKVCYLLKNSYPVMMKL